MVRRGLLLVVVLVSAALSAQVASADPVNAKKSDVLTAICGLQQLQVSVNGNGEFTPGHVIGSSAMFVPTSFNLTFSFTPPGGPTVSDTDTSAKNKAPKNAATCILPAALNTFTGPDGTFTISGTVTGFFTGN